MSEFKTGDIAHAEGSKGVNRWVRNQFGRWICINDEIETADLEDSFVNVEVQQGRITIVGNIQDLTNRKG